MKVLNEPLKFKASCFALLLALLWGGNSVSIKVALNGVPPLTLAAIRFSLGTFAIFAWARYKHIKLYMHRHERTEILTIVPIFVLQIYLLNMGTSLTLASRSTIFIFTYPFFIAIFAHYFIPGDRFNVSKMIGIGLAFSGIIVCFYEGLVDRQNTYIFGDAAVLLSSLLLGARQVYTKMLTQHIHPVRLLLWQGILSTPIFFFLCVLVESRTSLHFTPKIILAVLYQGFVVAGFCFILLTVLLQRYMASRLGVFAFASPLFGVALSGSLLGETISFSILIGVLFVAGGIGIVNSRGDG